MKNNIFFIRMANLEDKSHLIFLRSILLENSKESYASQSKESSEAWRKAYEVWLTNVFSNNSNIYILVAESDKTVIGAVTGIIDHRAPACDSLSGLCGWIQSLAVHPDFRQRGVASQLVNNLIALFKKNNVKKILLETTREAESLYKTIGFTCSHEKLLIFNNGD